MAIVDAPLPEDGERDFIGASALAKEVDAFVPSCQEKSNQG
jgi:hypothetical protein